MRPWRNFRRCGVVDRRWHIAITAMLNMLGTLSWRGPAQVAVMWFQKGWEPSRSEERQALRFRWVGLRAMALSITAIEVSAKLRRKRLYRGVSERLQQLQARKSAENQETPAAR